MKLLPSNPFCLNQLISHSSQQLLEHVGFGNITFLSRVVAIWYICLENGVKSVLPYPILGMSGLMVGEIRHERCAVCQWVGGGDLVYGKGGMD